MMGATITAVRTILLLNILLVATATLTGLVSWTWALVAAAVGMYALYNCCGSIIAYHRFHSHHSFKFKHKSLEWLFTMLGVLSGTGSPIGWVSIHQEHHRHSDGERDPHSPQSGAWRVLSFDYAYGENRWSIRRLLKSRAHRLIHQYYVLIIFAWVGVLFTALGPTGVVVGFSAPSVLVMMAQGLTNYVNHLESVGYKNFETSEHSKNVWWMVPLNFGEGWHNNHHANPTNYTTQHRPWEIDIAGLIIRVVGNPRRVKA